MPTYSVYIPCKVSSELNRDARERSVSQSRMIRLIVEEFYTKQKIRKK
jgi:hypothetical protein